MVKAESLVRSGFEKAADSEGSKGEGKRIAPENLLLSIRIRRRSEAPGSAGSRLTLHISGSKMMRLKGG